MSVAITPFFRWRTAAVHICNGPWYHRCGAAVDSAGLLHHSGSQCRFRHHAHPCQLTLAIDPSRLPSASGLHQDWLAEALVPVFVKHGFDFKSIYAKISRRDFKSIYAKILVSRRNTACLLTSKLLLCFAACPAG
jgi:hypothetical protein